MLNIEKVELYLFKHCNNFSSPYAEKTPWRKISINEIVSVQELKAKYRYDGIEYLLEIYITINNTEFRKAKLIKVDSTPEDEKEFYNLYNEWEKNEQG